MVIVLALFARVGSAQSLEDAEAAFERGDYTSAAGVAQSIAAHSHDNLAASVLAAKAWIAAGRPELAPPLLEPLLRAHSASAELHDVLGVAYRFLKRPDDAIRQLQMAARLSASVREPAARAAIWFDLGVTEESQQQWREAAKALGQAALLTPDDARVHLLLGRAQYRLNDVVSAEQSFKRAIAIDRRLPQAHLDLATVYRELGRSNEGLEECRSEQEIAPADGAAYRLAGEILLDMHRDKEAADELARATELRPRDATAHFDHARALMASGQLDAAEDEMRTASALDPNLFEVHYQLALLYRKKGDLKAAAEQQALYRKLLDEVREKRAGASASAAVMR